MEPALRKAWLSDALAELRGRRQLSYSSIADAIGRSRQAFHTAINRDPPSDELVDAIARAYPDLPRPGESKVIPMNRDAAMDGIERMERAVNGLLANNAMLLQLSARAIDRMEELSAEVLDLKKKLLKDAK